MTRSIVHDATGLLLAFFEGMVPIEIMAKLVCKSCPTCVDVIHTTHAISAEGANPSQTNSAIAARIATSE
jgi:hypothetical protein